MLGIKNKGTVNVYMGQGSFEQIEIISSECNPVSEIKYYFCFRIADLVLQLVGAWEGGACSYAVMAHNEVSETFLVKVHE